MKTLIILLLLSTIAMAGCDWIESSTLFHAKAGRTVCSESDLDMVKKEMAICTQTGYRPSHCYDIAKIAHCSIPEASK